MALIVKRNEERVSSPKPAFYILSNKGSSTLCTAIRIRSGGSKIMKLGPNEPPTFKNGTLET